MKGVDDLFTPAQQALLALHGHRVFADTAGDICIATGEHRDTRLWMDSVVYYFQSEPEDPATDSWLLTPSEANRRNTYARHAAMNTEQMMNYLLNGETS